MARPRVRSESDPELAACEQNVAGVSEHLDALKQTPVYPTLDRISEAVTLKRRVL
jgi:hypothetical protein